MTSIEKKLGKQNTTIEPTEKDPLLVNAHSSEFGNQETEVVKCTDRISKKTVRNIVTASCLWMGYLTVSAAYSLLGPFFPGEAGEKGASPTIIGVIVSSSPICVVFLAPIFGYLLPRLGLRFTLFSGLWLIGGAFVLLGFMSSPQISSGWMFASLCVLLRITEGVGSAMFFTASFSLLPELFPNHVGTVMGLFEVGGGLGFSIGPPIGGLLYTAGGFSLPFHVIGGATLLFLIPYFFLIPNFNCAPIWLSWKIVKILISNFIIILLLFSNALSMASLAFLNPTFAPFLDKYFHLDPLHIGLVFFAAPSAYLVFALIVGPLSDKLGTRVFIVTGLIMYGISFVFIGPPATISAPQEWITILAWVLIGIGAAFGLVPIFTDVLKTAKSALPSDIESETVNGVLSGVVSATVSLGEFMGPMLSGGLAQYFEFQTSAVLFGEVVIAVGTLLLGASLINWLILRKDKSHDSQLVVNA